MTDLCDRLLSWWRDNDGIFLNLDCVLPYITIYKCPSPVCPSTECVYAGHQSVQAINAHSYDPGALDETYMHSIPGRADAILAAYAHVIETGEPMETVENFSGFLPQGLVQADYRRIILPVKMKQGQPLMVCGSSVAKIH